MLSRKKGRLLITLLVVTGLAGTLNNSSISQKERKQAVLLMKTTRNDLLRSVEDLSERQMNFHPAPGQPSIRQLVASLATLEKRESAAIHETMRQPSNSEFRLKIAHRDEDLLEGSSEELPLTLPKAGKDDPSMADALLDFIEARNANIKYLRTSTEDLRNHVTETSVGWIDCYQRYLLLAEQARRSIATIGEIKALKDFPKK